MTKPAASSPDYIAPDFDGIPAELKALSNWVLWVPKWTGTKHAKVLIQCSGYGASTKNPRHWSSFEAAKNAYEEAQARGYVEYRERGEPPQRLPIGGIGFVFDGKEDESGLVYAGVDFDKVVSGSNVTPLAQERIKRLGSYTERSVSGTGIHVIVKARPLPRGIAHGGVEMYTSGRYFTFTGQPTDRSTIKAAPEEFAALAAELQASGGSDASTPKQASSRFIDNPELFTAAERDRVQAAFGTPEHAGSLRDGIEADLDTIRSAVSAIPSEAITAERDWMDFARGLAHHAAIYKNQAEDLYEILDGASQRAGNYNAEENRRRWDRYVGEALNHEKPITIATVFHCAKQAGWNEAGRAGAADDTGSAAQSGSVINRIPFSAVRHRQFLYGVDLLRGDITLLGSPGGAGKTSYALGVAISLATGKKLLGQQIWGGPAYKCLYINAEDAGMEMARRTWAACLHHSIDESELDNLSTLGAEDARVQKISLLRSSADHKSSVLDVVGFNHLRDLVNIQKPDLLVLDPLVALCNGGNVNDNGAMSLVMRQLKQLATEFNCAILIVLHTRKGGDLTNADAISGAASIVNLARRAIMPVTMTDDEATKLGVLPSERRQYFRLVDAKSNVAPPSSETEWYKLTNKELPNAEPPYPHGDRVQAIERVELSEQRGVSASAERQTARFELLKLIERGLEIDGIREPFSPNSNGKNKQRAILERGMAIVRDALAAVSDREYGQRDLRAIVERELEFLKREGWAVVETIKGGRFRRCQGLRTAWERTPWAQERAVLNEYGGPTVRTDEEQFALFSEDMEQDDNVRSRRSNGQSTVN